MFTAGCLREADCGYNNKKKSGLITADKDRKAMMDDKIQSEIELSAVLDLVPYLDIPINAESGQEVTLKYIVDNCKVDNDHGETLKIIKDAIETNPEWKEIELVNQSKIEPDGTDTEDNWTDDYIQGCTFKDNDGNYYVTYRGTGDGRWGDNGEGITMPSTAMQKAAQEYFDAMAEEYLIEAHNNGKRIIVSGHSKGGNEAQYVFMMSNYEYIIDNCYSLDGQGFSGKALEDFKKKYGDRLGEKLSKMYSVNGKNDYVHDLGYVIIPEENTFFVETTGNSFEDYHKLERMIGDRDGNYLGLKWKDKNGNPVEQGAVGKLAQKLSKEMMNLDDDDLDGVAMAVMSFLDMKNEIIGNANAEPTDYVDFVANGIPLVLHTIFCTEEGWNFMGWMVSTEDGRAFAFPLIESCINKLNEKIGPIGTVALLFVIALLAINLVKLAANIIYIFKVLDFIIDTGTKISNINKKIRECLAAMKATVISEINKIIAQSRRGEHGYINSNFSPHILLDTYSLTSYAQRLNAVSTRVSNVDSRLNSLYWRVGLLDLWKLRQTNILNPYRWWLNRCAAYLTETADSFNNAETDIVKQLQ